MKINRKKIKRGSKTARRQEAYVFISEEPNTLTVTKFGQNITFTVQGNQSKLHKFLNSAKGAIKWLIY